MSLLWVLVVVVLAVGIGVVAVAVRHTMSALRELRTQLAQLGDLKPALDRVGRELSERQRSTDDGVTHR